MTFHQSALPACRPGNRQSPTPLASAAAHQPNGHHDRTCCISPWSRTTARAYRLGNLKRRSAPDADRNRARNMQDYARPGRAYLPSPSAGWARAPSSNHAQSRTQGGDQQRGDDYESEYEDGFAVRALSLHRSLPQVGSRIPIEPRFPVQAARQLGRANRRLVARDSPS